jgi:hypothetical protein
MITVSHQAMEQSRARTRLAYTALACLALATTVLVSACGSSGHASASGQAASGASATQQSCQQVDATLSNGPDPGTDPLGYAEAQILPLEQIHASDPTLGTAISTLAVAYQGYYSAHGTGSTVTSALNSAIKRINSLCPGAGATT